METSLLGAGTRLCHWIGWPEAEDGRLPSSVSDSPIQLLPVSKPDRRHFFAARSSISLAPL
jgi:hypothetical protein